MSADVSGELIKAIIAKWRADESTSGIPVYGPRELPEDDEGFPYSFVNDLADLDFFTDSSQVWEHETTITIRDRTIDLVKIRIESIGSVFDSDTLNLSIGGGIQYVSHRLLRIRHTSEHDVVKKGELFYQFRTRKPRTA